MPHSSRVWKKCARNGHCIAPLRLQDHGVPGDDRGHGHARHNGEREVPGRDHRAYAQGQVVQLVMLAGQLNRRRRFFQPQRLASVELRKVDCLGDIGIGLGPVLFPPRKPATRTSRICAASAHAQRGRATRPGAMPRCASSSRTRSVPPPPQARRPRGRHSERCRRPARDVKD